MTNNYIDKAIKSFEYLEGWQAKDGESVVSEVATEGLRALRALQSQPATDGLAKVREALEIAKSAAASVSMSKHRLVLIEGENCYWQTDDWCRWVSTEVLDSTTEALAILDQQAAHNPTTTIRAGWKMVPVEAVVRLNAISKQWSVDEIKHNEKYEDCDFESGYDEMVKNIREIQSMLSAAPDLNGEGV